MKRPRKLTFSSSRKTAVRVLVAIAALQLTGCVVGPKYHQPAVQAPPAYKEVGDWKPAEPNDQNLGGNWWTVFQDPQLDALELQVNVSNQNLKAAEAQFQQARAALRYNRADYYPTVTAGPSATRTRVSANAPTASLLRGATYNDFVFPFDVSYQADVWGRVRKTVESFREQAQASAADLATVNLSMHADLAVDRSCRSTTAGHAPRPSAELRRRHRCAVHRSEDHAARRRPSATAVLVSAGG